MGFAEFFAQAFGADAAGSVGIGLGLGISCAPAVAVWAAAHGRVAFRAAGLHANSMKVSIARVKGSARRYSCLRRMTAVIGAGTSRGGLLQDPTCKIGMWGTHRRDLALLVMARRN